MTDVRRLMRLAAATLVAGAGAAAYVLACGPFMTILRPVESIRPGHLDAYDKGNVGVVREHFARRYLVQAYRRFAGKPAIPVALPAVPETRVPDTLAAWQELHKTVTGADVTVDTESGIGNYSVTPNCMRDTFAVATATGKARIEKYGAKSAQVLDWFRAQDAVLSSCGGALTLPDPAPANADALTRADRAYQIAAATFYGGRYEDAAKLFRQIAADSASPWRPYGRYLAGRTMVRDATLPEKLDTATLRAAQAEFRATLADPGAASLHNAAQEMLDLIGYRLDPTRRLRELAATLATADSATASQVTDYEWLLNGLLGDVVSYKYAEIDGRDAIVRSGDLSDWILVMQGTGDEAAARAVEQWKRTSSAPWLVAALWKVPAAHADAPALLDAASKIPSTSPAFMTVAFLRVRLLAARGGADQARALLATLPRTARERGDTEAVNLLNAERLMLAASMTDLLQAAPRRVVTARLDISSWKEPDPDDAKTGEPLQVFDDDAAIVFSRRLPLSRLVEGAKSDILPARLRVRLASAAFTRAWMLNRLDDALAVAPVLRTLSPALAADLQTFESAAPADRHVAALRLILRTPGLHASVRGVEDDGDDTKGEVSRNFEHLTRRNWWCSFSKEDYDAPRADAEVVQSVYPAGKVTFPPFLTAAEQAAAQKEIESLSALGTAPNYLADEAVKWAKARPQDPDAAEALAHAVEGTRWGCTEMDTTDHSRDAFQTLHKLFPKSEWALKTKYWY